MVGGEKEKRSLGTQIGAQRSGSDLERRSSGVSELSCEHGSERYEACDDEGL